MFKLEKSSKEILYSESDAKLCEDFSQAGFGFVIISKRLFHPLEAAYLEKMGKSRFAPKAAPTEKSAGRDFGFALAAYSRIRATGRIVRPFIKQTHYFRVYAPGVGREAGRPSQLIALLPGEFPSPKTISDEVKTAHLSRLDLIIACGTEKEMQFYKISSFNF